MSDSLNHASIIDGVRLCKAKRYRYEPTTTWPTCAPSSKEARARGRQAREVLIATDGVFSMDGYVANLGGHLRPRRRVTAR